MRTSVRSPNSRTTFWAPIRGALRTTGRPYTEVVSITVAPSSTVLWRGSIRRSGISGVRSLALLSTNSSGADLERSQSLFLVQETPRFYGDHFDTYTIEGLDIVDGAIGLPDGPGLGISLDEEVLRAPANQGHDQYIPTRYHDDDSVADW